MHNLYKRQSYLSQYESTTLSAEWCLFFFKRKKLLQKCFKTKSIDVKIKKIKTRAVLCSVQYPLL